MFNVHGKNLAFLAGTVFSTIDDSPFHRTCLIKSIFYLLDSSGRRLIVTTYQRSTQDKRQISLEMGCKGTVFWIQGI